MHEDLDGIETVVDAVLGRAPVLDAVDALGLPEGDRLRLEDRLRSARGEHARLRRREHELSALFSSARELAELRDADALLARLVERAHQMTGADLTYLSEFDPATRALHVRRTSGAVSTAFQHLLVPPGRGLASEVVESRTPRWVADYREYARDRHDEGIDDAVSAEGVISILGVPMLSGDDVLGVLFVANREPYSFAPDEIALLSALADHASVVLQTARTLKDLRQSEDETRKALASLTAHLAERDRANTVHRELVQAVLAGGGFSPVAETLASALGRSVAVVDAREQVIAAAGLPLSPWMLELNDADRDAVAESRRSGYCVTLPRAGGCAVAALTAGAQYFGALLLGEGDLALGGVDARTVERAAQVCALLALQQEAVSEAEHRVRTELVADLLDDVPERRSDVRRRAQRLGVDPSRLDSLLLLAVPGEYRTIAARAVLPFLDDHALVGEYRGFVVAAYDADRRSPDPELVRARVARATRTAVLAVSPPAAHGGLPAAFVTAMRTARLLAALGVDDLATSTDHYLPYAAALDTDARTLAAFLRSSIGVVRAYDEERGTDLIGTLHAFVKNGASPTRTARALTVHTNTVLQRLERLDHLLGADWRDDERLFRIGMAVRLDALRRSAVEQHTVRAPAVG